jgi:hypothetical protein
MVQFVCPNRPSQTESRKRVPVRPHPISVIAQLRAPGHAPRCPGGANHPPAIILGLHYDTMKHFKAAVVSGCARRIKMIDFAPVKR